MSFLSPSLRLENLSTKPIMSLDHLTEEKRYNKNNIVAKWCAPIKGKMYRIELEHGTTSGRRMIWVNGKVSLYFLLIKKSHDFPTKLNADLEEDHLSLGTWFLLRDNLLQHISI